MYKWCVWFVTHRDPWWVSSYGNGTEGTAAGNIVWYNVS